ncbi:MAG: hypothetical protein ABI054_11475 [Planctomycetota bacterium]
MALANFAHEWGGDEFEIAPGDSETKTIDCENRMFVRVQVVDTSGKPRSGIPVLMKRKKPQFLFDTTLAATTAGTQGLAELGPADLEPNSEYFLNLAGAFPESLRVLIDLRSLPAEPIQLVMPAFGSLEIRILNSDGTRFLGSGDVRLESDQDRLALAPFPAELLDIDSGRAVFERVALGLKLNARIELSGRERSLTTQGKGPEKEGQTVVLEARLEATLPTFTGRADGPRGPLRFHELECIGAVQGKWGSKQFTQRVTTDESGRFALTLQEELPGGGEGTLLVRDTSETRPLGAVRSIDVKQAGNPLGAWRLEEPRLLASGYVVDETGDPAVRAVELVNPESILGIAWAVQTLSDDTGGFELRGWCSESKLKILAGVRGASGRYPIQVDQGATGVVLSLARPHRPESPP